LASHEAFQVGGNEKILKPQNPSAGAIEHILTKSRNKELLICDKVNEIKSLAGADV
jgi:hypothetical protein